MKKWFLIMVLIITLAGCSFDQSTKTITDGDTMLEVPIIEDVSPDMFTYQHRYDNMERGNHDYVEKELIINPNMNLSEISRGDVVFFEIKDGEKYISRVIGLPGEKIKITKGQIYINGKLLKTFYGKAHRFGLIKEDYFATMDEKGYVYNKEGMREVFEQSMEEIQLSDTGLFLVCDDWFRGVRMELTVEKLMGTVVGYLK